jgi:hypothetical protein
MAIAPESIESDDAEFAATRISAGRLWSNHLMGFGIDSVVTLLVLRLLRRMIGLWPPLWMLLIAALLLALLAPFSEQAWVRWNERRIVRNAAKG